MSQVKKLAIEKKLKKIDATGSLFLEVTQGDIDKSTRKNPTCCAFAKATERVIPGVKSVYFFRTAAWIEYDDRLIRYILPQNVQDGIKRFDQGGQMHPGVYRLATPSKSHTLRANRARQKNRTRKSPRGSTGAKRPVAVAQPFDVRSISPKKWPTPKK